MTVSLKDRDDGFVSAKRMCERPKFAGRFGEGCKKDDLECSCLEAI